MTIVRKTLFIEFFCLVILMMPHTGTAKISGQDGTCSIYDPIQDKIVQAQWTGSCQNGKAEGTGTAKWMGPSTTYMGRQFPFQYDGDVKNGRFHGRGRLVRENIAMTGKFTNGNLNNNGKMIGQMLPTGEIINGKMTMEEAFSATASQVMEFNCNNGECSNSAYLNRRQQEELATYLFGATVGAYLLKEGATHLIDAFLATASSTPGLSSTQSTNTKNLGPFNSCNEMFSHCEKRCGSKSNENNRWGILDFGQSHKEKCINLCQSEGTSCESGIDNKFVIRTGYCEAVCIGYSDSYKCKKRCEKDFDFWKF